MTFAGFLLLGGRAADLLGRRRVFVSGLVLFALASLAGGLADSQALLIAARAVAGPRRRDHRAGLALDPHDHLRGGPRRATARVGIWGAMGGAGGAAGVLLGGVLTDLLSWRWILFINVPIGLLAALFAPALHRRGARDRAASGTSTSPARSRATLGLSVLVLAIVRTDVTGWGSAPTLALLAAGLVAARAVPGDRGPVRPAPR